MFVQEPGRVRPSVSTRFAAESNDDLARSTWAMLIVSAGYARSLKAASAAKRLFAFSLLYVFVLFFALAADNLLARSGFAP